MTRRQINEDPQNALLGDLESIRTLLDDDDGGEDALPARASDDMEVPVLEDIVDLDPPDAVGADSVPESRSETGVGLDDDLFRALLSDQWRDSANEVLKQARAVIADHRTDWTPEETDTLNDALKVRIDATIQGWMRGMVVTHMADLHEVLLKTLSQEIKTTISAIIEQRKETTDGQ